MSYVSSSYRCPYLCSCVSSVCSELNTPFVIILVSSFLDPRVHRDRIIHPTRWSLPASAAHRARRLWEVCRCSRLARARHRSRQTEARWCLCWLRPAHLLRRWSCPARLRLHWFLSSSALAERPLVPLGLLVVYEGMVYESLLLACAPRYLLLASALRCLLERPPERPRESAPPERPRESAPPERPRESAPSERPRESAPPERPRESAPPERPRESAPPERPRESALPERPQELVPSSSPLPLLVPSSSPWPTLVPSSSPGPPLVPSSSPGPPLVPSSSLLPPLVPASSPVPPLVPSSSLWPPLVPSSSSSSPLGRTSPSSSPLVPSSSALAERPLVPLGLLVVYEGMVWRPEPEPAPHQRPPVPARAPAQAPTRVSATRAPTRVSATRAPTRVSASRAPPRVGPVQLTFASAGPVQLTLAHAGPVQLSWAPAGSVRLPRTPSDHASRAPPSVRASWAPPWDEELPQEFFWGGLPAMEASQAPCSAMAARAPWSAMAAGVPGSAMGPGTGALTPTHESTHPPLPFRCYTARDVPIGRGGNVRLFLPLPCFLTLMCPYLVRPVPHH